MQTFFTKLCSAVEPGATWRLVATLFTIFVVTQHDRLQAAEDYASSATNRVLASAAINQVNRILDSHSEIRVCPGWEPTGSKSGACIPVYLVSKGMKAPPSVAFVENGKRAVFLDAPRIAELGGIELEVPIGLSGVEAEIADRNSIKDLLAGGHSRVDATNFLCFLLLHELGHILSGHEGSTFSPVLEQQVKPGPQVTITTNRLKERELAADRQVLKFLRSSLEAPPDSLRHKSAESVVTALKITRLYLTSRAQIWRRGNEDSLIFQLSFGDLGITHPNLEYRLALIVYALDPSTNNRIPMVRFLDQRRQRWSLTRHTVEPGLREELDARLRAQLEHDLDSLNDKLGIESATDGQLPAARPP